GEGFGFFWIRGLHGWKISIGFGLLPYYGDMVVTGPFQYFRNCSNGGAVKGGEHDLKIVLSLGVEIPVFNGGVYKGFIDLSIYQFDQCLIRTKLDVLIGKSVYCRNDLPVLGRNYLTAIAPIYLIAIIFRWIMGSGK